jgi:hypothetical protein
MELITIHRITEGRLGLSFLEGTDKTFGLQTEYKKKPARIVGIRPSLEPNSLRMLV